jgi:ABC-type branched-subunit amino acid transport system substrate-binding protein
MVAAQPSYVAGSVIPPSVLMQRRVSRRSFDSGFGAPRRRFDKLRIALLAPLSGPAGLWGPSCQTSARLACQEINAQGGIQGREVELVFSDAGRSPQIVSAETLALVTEGGAEAVIGMHISAVRVALVEALKGRVPYVYTPVYEGGEHTPGVFMIGETPALQLKPSIAWLSERRRARRWYLVGNDYIWPRVSHEAARRYVEANGGKIVGEEFVPFGCDDYQSCLDAIRKSKADAVLVSMVGNDCVTFNRAFADAGLARNILRLSAASEENTLLGIGADNAENLFFAAGYLANLQTPENEAFLDRYYAAFGADAPVPNTIGQSCYEGVRLYGELVRQAASLELGALSAVSEGLSATGARGNARMRGRHLRTDIYLAEADGLDFRILQRFPA